LRGNFSDKGSSLDILSEGTYCQAAQDWQNQQGIFKIGGPTGMSGMSSLSSVSLESVFGHIIIVTNASAAMINTHPKLNIPSGPQFFCVVVSQSS
jgi:hypothetical protein